LLLSTTTFFLKKKEDNQVRCFAKIRYNKSYFPSSLESDDPVSSSVIELSGRYVLLGHELHRVVGSNSGCSAKSLSAIEGKPTVSVPPPPKKTKETRTPKKKLPKQDSDVWILTWIFLVIN